MKQLGKLLVPALLGAAVLAGCTDFKISPPKKEEAPGAVGRYAIASPQKEIFLLDTATGKTWLLTYEQGTPRWTPVHMEEDEAKPSTNMLPESKAPDSKVPASKPPESKSPPPAKDNTAIDNAAKPPPPRTGT